MCVSFGDSDGEEKDKNLISERDGEGLTSTPPPDGWQVNAPRHGVGVIIYLKHLILNLGIG